MAKARKPKAVRPSTHADTLSIIDGVLRGAERQVGAAERQSQVRNARNYQVGVVDRQAEFAALDAAHTEKVKSDAAKGSESGKSWWESGLETIGKGLDFVASVPTSAVHELQDAFSGDDEKRKNFSVNDFWNQIHHPSEHIKPGDIMDTLGGASYKNLDEQGKAGYKAQYAFDADFQKAQAKGDKAAEDWLQKQSALAPFSADKFSDGRSHGKPGLLDAGGALVLGAVLDPLTYITGGAHAGNVAKNAEKGIAAAAKAEHAAAEAEALSHGLTAAEAYDRGVTAAKAVQKAAEDSGVIDRAVRKGLHGLTDAEKAAEVPYLAGKAIGKGGIRFAGQTVIPEAVTKIVSEPFTAARNAAFSKFVELNPKLRRALMLGGDATKDAKMAYRYGITDGSKTVTELMQAATKAKTFKSIEHATEGRYIGDLEKIFEGVDRGVVKTHLMDVMEGSTDAAAFNALKDAGMDTTKLREWLNMAHEAAGGRTGMVGYHADYFPHMLTPEAREILGKGVGKTGIGGGSFSPRILTKPGKDIEFLGHIIDGATPALRRAQANKALQEEAVRVMAANPVLGAELKDASISMFGEHPMEVLKAYARQAARRKAEIDYATELGRLGIGTTSKSVAAAPSVAPSFTVPFGGSRGASSYARSAAVGGAVGAPLATHGSGSWIVDAAAGLTGAGGTVVADAAEHANVVQGIADLFQRRINEGGAAIGGAIDSGGGFAHVLADLDPVNIAAKDAAAQASNLSARLAAVSTELPLAERLAAKRAIRAEARKARDLGVPTIGRTHVAAREAQEQAINSAIHQARTATEEASQHVIAVEAMQTEFNNLGHDVALDHGFGYLEHAADPMGLGGRVLRDEGTGQAVGTTNSARFAGIQSGTLTREQHAVFEDLLGQGATRSQAWSQAQMSAAQRAEVAARQAGGETVQEAFRAVDHAGRLSEALSLAPDSDGFEYLRTGIAPGDVQRNHKVLSDGIMGQVSDIFGGVPAESVDEFVQTLVDSGVRFGNGAEHKRVMKALVGRVEKLSAKAATEADAAAARIISPETIAHVIDQRSALLADLGNSGLLPQDVVRGVLSRADTTVPYIAAPASEFEQRIAALGRAADELFPLARAQAVENVKPALVRQGLLEHVAASTGVEDVLVANAVHVTSTDSQLNMAESLLDMGDMVPSGPLSGADIGIANSDTGSTWAQVAQDPATPLNVRLAAAYQSISQNASAQMGAIGSQVMPNPGGMLQHTPMWQLTQQANRVQLVSQMTQAAKDAIGLEVKKGLLTPEWAMKHIRDLEKVQVQSKGFWKVYDGVNTYLKRWMLATPGFPQRNVLGGVWNNTMHDIAWQDYQKAMAWKAGQVTDTEARFLEDAIGGGYVKTEFVDVGKDLKKRYAYNPLSSRNKVVAGIGNVNQHVEDILRGAAAAKVLRTGGTLDDAVEMVTKLHFNYADLGRGEQYLRRLIPFYTYTSRNLPLQMEMLLRHPQTYSRYFMFRKNVESLSDPDAETPDWLRSTLGIRLPFMKGGGHSYATLSLPIQDAGRFLEDPSVPNLYKTVLNSTSPIIKTPLELYMGKKFFSDAPIRDDVMTPAGSSMVQPWLGAALGQLGIAKRQKSGDWLVSEQTKYVMDAVLPQLAQASRLAPGHVSTEGMSTGERSKVQVPEDNQLSSVIGYLLGVGVQFNTLEKQRKAAAAKKRNKSLSDSKRKKQDQLLNH